MKVLITWSIILLDCFFDLTLEPTCDFVHYFFLLLLSEFNIYFFVCYQTGVHGLFAPINVVME